MKLLKFFFLVMVNYVREMIVKKCCRYSEYGLFEYLLFLVLFVCLFVFLMNSIPHCSEQTGFLRWVLYACEQSEQIELFIILQKGN